MAVTPVQCQSNPSAENMNRYLKFLGSHSGPILQIIAGLSMDIATILFWRHKRSPAWSRIIPLL